MNQNSPIELPSHAFLSQLAHDDPVAYEALRANLISALMEQAPDSNKIRLRGLQFRIDCIRSLSKTALGSTVKVYAMMWQSFRRMNQELNQFKRVDLCQPTRRSARIIEFRRSSGPRDARG